MRNLKKILALVLALVMSLSLMATAGAAETTAAGGNYKTAQEVLEGLKVFKGDAGTGDMRYDQSINRAETAALVYRIATADVTDAQAGIYTNHPFKDVANNHWGKGYIAYDFNAEIIKGTNAEQTTFEPDAKVTGHQTLAMILRTLGYGRNHEFEGTGWEIQTAATAKQAGLLNGVTAADEARLGEPATRGLVAQILFNALLQKTVKYSALNPYNYEPTTGETLGYQKFRLEEIEGVVTGNEFADLKSVQVLDAGMTQLMTEDGLRDLAVSTRITDIGESRYAYITGTTVLAMGDTGRNKTTTTGAGIDISTTAKFNAAAGMSAASGIEYYINFGRVGTYTCDQRLEFVVKFSLADTNGNAYIPGTVNGRYTTLAQIVNDFEATYTGGAALNSSDVGMTLISGSVAGNTVTYSKIIRAESDISEMDLAVIRGIFVAADNNNSTNTRFEGVEGDVFVGTFSETNTSVGTTDARDLSNQISYKKFVEDYISDELFDVNWNTSSNGDWVKFVDNNGDGKAEYAFKTTSWLDEALETYTNKGGDTVTQYNRFNDDTTNVINGRYNVRYLDNNGNDTDVVPAVNSKVVCALIDNQVLVEPALDETVTVSDYNWKEDVINTDKGEYGQSFIGNATNLQERLSSMANKTEYKVYFDHFGYVRAFEIPGGTTYALVTEVYARNEANGNLVQNWPVTTELIIKDAKATEYNLNGGRNSIFFTKNSGGAWAQISNLAVAANYWNWLQPATAHMGVTTAGLAPEYGVGTFSNTPYVFWAKNRQLAREINSFTANDTFNYGANNYGSGVASVSFTNIAIANIEGENATLTGAAQVRRDKQGNVLYWDTNHDSVFGNVGDKARYAVDYVQLTTDDTVKGQTRYAIADGYTGWKGANGNTYVNATHDTEYYVIYNGDCLYFTDYTNMIALTNKDNHIRAAYAVARDTSADDANEPYWVADIIVYEIQNYDGEFVKTSTALVYYNPSRSNDQIQRLNTIDSANGLIDAIPDPLVWANYDGRTNDFGPAYAGYGFYQFWNGTTNDAGDLAVEDIVLIDGTNVDGVDLRWNSNLIYAGTVVREIQVATRGTYIDVDTNNDGITNVSLLIKDSAESNVYSVTTDYTKYEINSNWAYNEAGTLRYSNVRSSEIKAGDRIVWIGGGAINVQKNDNNTQTASFVVDLGNDVTSGERANAELKWLTANFLLEQTRADNTVAPISAASTGLWQKIMAEQTAPVTPASSKTAIPAQLTITTGDKSITVDVPADGIVNIAEPEWTKLTEGVVPTYTFTPAKDNTITEVGNTLTGAKKNETVEAKGTVAVAVDATETFRVTTIGDTDESAARSYEIKVTYKPQAGTFGELQSKDMRYVQVTNGVATAPNTDKKYDAKIVVKDMSLSVDTIVRNLKAVDEKGAVVAIDSWSAWDSSLTTEVANETKTGTIQSARWLKLILKNSLGETKTVWVYREDLAADESNWVIPTFTVTIGEGIKLFPASWDGKFTSAQVAAADGYDADKRELTLAYDNTDTFVVAVDQEGTFAITGGKATVGPDTLQNGLYFAYVQFTENGSVTFTKTNDPKMLTVIAGKGVVGSNDTALVLATVTHGDNSALPCITKKGEALSLKVDAPAGYWVKNVTWSNGTKTGNLEQINGSYWKITAEDTSAMVAGEVIIGVELVEINVTVRIVNKSGAYLEVTYLKQGANEFETTVNDGVEDDVTTTIAVDSRGPITIKATGAEISIGDVTGVVGGEMVDARNWKCEYPLGNVTITVNGVE